MNNGQNLRKCISLSGPGWFNDANFPNSYLFNEGGGTPPNYSNRTYVRNVSGTKWIKLWVSWNQLQPTQVNSRTESWNQLSNERRDQLARLDAQINAANIDGIQVILGMYHEYPTWSSGAAGPDPSGSGKPAVRKLPVSVAGNSPYDWFVGYFMARYKYHAPPTSNGLGPVDGSTLGNPLGAYITAFEIANEPNFLNWPRSGMGAKVGQMLTTAENSSFYYGSLSPADYRIWVFGPGTSDVPSPGTFESNNYNVDYVQFSIDVAVYLKNWWHPRLYVGWTHHNYYDIKYVPDLPRVEDVRQVLYADNWRGGGDRYIWLTEGGYSLPANYASLPRGVSLSDPPGTQLYWQNVQASKVSASFTRMSSWPDIYMFAQHGICDALSATFNSELRDDLDGGNNGQAREVWYRWAGFPGSPGA